MANYTTIGQIDPDKWELIIPADVKKRHDERLKWAKKNLSPAYWYPYGLYNIRDVKIRLKKECTKDFPVKLLK